MATIKKSLYDWCIEKKNTKLIEEWDEEKNQLSPKNVTFATNKKYFWKCLKGHKWKCSVFDRTKGNGCPICSNRQLLVGYNDLLTMCPEVAKEWHPTLNGNLKPTDVMYRTTKRAWWLCSTCENVWETSIRDRTYRKMSGCPKCSLIRRGESKRLTSLIQNGGIKNQTLIDEWDYEKNFPYTPNNFTEGSNKSVWWKCSNNHSWKSKIGNRSILNRGCPYCNNFKVLPGYNDFATVHPELLSEWDYEKNGDLKPNEVMSGSRTKVWWKCKIGHSYMAALNHRTSSDSTGCPICYSGRQTSFAEQAVYFYVKKAFPDAINRYKNIFGSRFELDIYIPSFNTAIEYDGEAWHKKDKLKREQEKYKLCNSHGIRLIRLREKGYDLGSDIADYGFVYENLYKHNVLEYAITELLKFLLCHPLTLPFDINIERDKNEIFNNIYKIEEDSFEKNFPELAKEWHPTKNGNLKPNMFKPYSDHKVWWLCSKCGYEYQSTIGHRSYGTGCPKCGIHKSAKAKSRRVAMIDLKTGEVLKVFESIAEAGRQTKNSTGNIGSVCKGIRPAAGGYIWKYVD